MRIVAIDWSGSADPREQARRIWAATVEDGELTSLTGGRTRSETIECLVREAQSRPDLTVGIDFAFSFPAWFTRELGAHAAYDVWERVGHEGEAWLTRCEPPFFGRRGTRRPTGCALFRRTELRCRPVTGITPKSIFQLYGAGAVGTGSIRGMPFLQDLHDVGFSIWPFDPPSFPRVVEIYPRALTGPVVKRDRKAREAYLETSCLPWEHRRVAVQSEDAFDAAISALAMGRGVQELRGLTRAIDEISLLEGEIWLRDDDGLSTPVDLPSPT